MGHRHVAKVTAHSPRCSRDYNCGMHAKPAAKARKQNPHADHQREAARLETLGLIVIVLLILAVTITRSWHHIHWGLR